MPGAGWKYSLIMSLYFVGFCLSSSATTLRQPPHLTGETTRNYSHIHWQNSPGPGIPIRLLPSVNATGKASYSTQNLSGKSHNSEVRTIPDALDSLIYQLVKNTHFLNPTIATEPTQYSLQFHLRQFDTLYAPGDRNHLLNLGFAHIDRAWSQLNGDNKPSVVKLIAVIYDEDFIPVLEVPISAKLLPCQRSGNVMTFSPVTPQQFLNGFATTTTGQAFIAAVNRALQEVASHFGDLPIVGKVVKVEQNDIYINIGEGVVYPNEELDLIYQSDNSFNYVVGRLAVEETWPNMSLVHSLDVPSSNVLAGDSIELKKQASKPKLRSVAGKPIICSKVEKQAEQRAELENKSNKENALTKETSMQEAATNNPSRKNTSNNHWAWKTEE
ncbi:hypothetical protein [Pleionea sediminis]|uniref:hypothetical protein n=1 Tax=Pleionea sediminis TaxID=2569479 RepID=UPI001185F9D9|nr:hypothetical protein [Pleionea sediminis]